MPTRYYKNAAKEIESLGYQYDRTNSKQFDFFVQPGFPEVSLNPTINERDARRILNTLHKRHGVTTDRDRSKRNVETVKARQAAERERLAAEYARHEEELAALLSRRDEQLGGLGATLAPAQVSALIREIERREREMRELRRLMTEVPAPNAHSGRVAAQHRA